MGDIIYTRPIICVQILGILVPLTTHKCQTNLNIFLSLENAFILSTHVHHNPSKKRHIPFIYLLKDMVADLQGAFISLAKSVEEDPPNDDIENSEVS